MRRQELIDPDTNGITGPRRVELGKVKNHAVNPKTSRGHPGEDTASTRAPFAQGDGNRNPKYFD